MGFGARDTSKRLFFMGKWIHRLSNVNHELRTGYCSTCGKVKLKAQGKKNKKTGFIGLRCRVACNINGRFGFLPPDGQECEICGSTEKLRYDHNHNTGKFRGWICNSCNLMIGSAKEDQKILLNAINYLKNK